MGMEWGLCRHWGLLRGGGDEKCCRECWGVPRGRPGASPLSSIGVGPQKGFLQSLLLHCCCSRAPCPRLCLHGTGSGGRMCRAEPDIGGQYCGWWVFGNEKRKDKRALCSAPALSAKGEMETCHTATKLESREGRPWEGNGRAAGVRVHPGSVRAQPPSVGWGRHGDGLDPWQWWQQGRSAGRSLAASSQPAIHGAVIFNILQSAAIAKERLCKDPISELSLRFPSLSRM